MTNAISINKIAVRELNSYRRLLSINELRPLFLLGPDAASTTKTYEYGPGDSDSGTQLTRIEVTGDEQSVTEYTYDEMGRQSSVSEDNVTVLQNRYDAMGNRVYVDDNGTVRQFLIDSNNLTGYAQILEEQQASSPNRTYTIGLDVIAQRDAGAATRLLLPDGHGSTRLLLDNGGIIEQYDYDAYGNLLNMAASAAATSLLYSGEFTDPSGQQYLRARYYDPTNGRFNRLDPFAGNSEDPQSLHKYLYAHADPINGVDPTGLLTLNDVVGTLTSGLYNGLRSFGPTIFANQIAKTAITRAGFGFITSLGFNFYADYYLPPLADELQSMANMLGSIHAPAAIKASQASAAVSELNASIHGTSAARPAFNALVGPIVTTLQSVVTAEHMLALFQKTQEVTFTEILESSTGIKVNFVPNPGRLLVAAALGPLGGSFDPSEDVRLVRLAIEAATESNRAALVQHLTSLQRRARDFGLISVEFP